MKLDLIFYIAVPGGLLLLVLLSLLIACCLHGCPCRRRNGADVEKGQGRRKKTSLPTKKKPSKLPVTILKPKANKQKENKGEQSKKGKKEEKANKKTEKDEKTRTGRVDNDKGNKPERPSNDTIQDRKLKARKTKVLPVVSFKKGPKVAPTQSTKIGMQDSEFGLAHVDNRW